MFVATEQIQLPRRAYVEYHSSDSDECDFSSNTSSFFRSPAPPSQPAPGYGIAVAMGTPTTVSILPPPPPPPYAVSLPGSPAMPVTRRSSVSSGSSNGSPYRHNPYATTKSPSPVRRVIRGVSHQPLIDACRFVSWPAQLASTGATPPVLAGLPHVTIDQVKFELSGNQLRWLLREITGVLPVHVEESGTGAFTVFTKDDADYKTLLQHHRCMLFDHHGVWAPADEKERQTVTQYMHSREFRQRGQRLPREMLAIKTRRARGV